MHCCFYLYYYCFFYLVCTAQTLVTFGKYGFSTKSLIYTVVPNSNQLCWASIYKFVLVCQFSTARAHQTSRRNTYHNLLNNIYNNIFIQTQIQSYLINTQGWILNMCVCVWISIYINMYAWMWMWLFIKKETPPSRRYKELSFPSVCPVHSSYQSNKNNSSLASHTFHTSHHHRAPFTLCYIHHTYIHRGATPSKRSASTVLTQSQPDHIVSSLISRSVRYRQSDKGNRLEYRIAHLLQC